MTWLQWALALFLLVTFIRFVMGKMRDPMNPAGFRTDECLRRMGLDKPTESA